MTVLLRLAEPPLDPSGDQARALLRRELLRPEYHDTNLVQRLLDWVDRTLGSAVDRVSQVPAVPTFAAILAFLLLAIGLTWLLSRARRTARRGTGTGPVLTAETVRAAELRARAERALAEGRNADALVEAFRALAVREVERGRIDDRPGATAHEVAVAVGAAHPEHRSRVAATAASFDAVLYGDRPATRDQAAEALRVDDELAARR